MMSGVSVLAVVFVFFHVPLHKPLFESCGSALWARILGICHGYRLGSMNFGPCKFNWRTAAEARNLQQHCLSTLKTTNKAIRHGIDHPFLESQVTQKNAPLFPKVAHNSSAGSP